MRQPRFLLFALSLAIPLALTGCRDGNSDVTGANKSLVRLTVDAPATAKSGTPFGIQIRALNIGVAGVHNCHVSVMFPLPLVIVSVSAPSGTSATLSNSTGGGRVEWDFSTLDSNSESKLDITVIGTLAPMDGSKTLTIVAQMTAQGINPGEAVAQDDVTLIQ